VEEIMSGEKGGSKADTLVKVVLFFFISLLSFSVGTFVGKQVSDSDHRRMALEGEFGGGRSVASEDGHGEAAAPNDKISEKEVEALTEEFVNREKTREPASHEGKAHGEEAAAAGPGEEKAAAGGYKAYPRGKEVKGAEVKKEVKAEAAHVDAKVEAIKADAKKAKADVKVAAAGDAHSAHGAVDATSKTAAKVADGQAPTDGAAEEKAALPTMPSVASSAVGKYTVQVGSYPEEKDAKTKAADLKGKGWNAFYLPATVKGKTWYRVLVGLFNNQESAKQFRSQFMKEANTQAAIVQKIVQ
jgi:cell division septation protein DedD